MNNKSIRLIALILGIMCFIFSVCGILKATSDSVLKMPLVDFILNNVSISEVEEINQSLEDALDDIDDMSKDEIREFEDETDIEWENVEDFIENPSINKLIKMGDNILEYESDLGVEDYSAGYDYEDILNVLKVFRIVLIVYGLIIALFSLLGGLFKKIVFPIIAIILSFLFYLVFVGIILFVLFIVFSIAQIVFICLSKRVPRDTPESL